jgi:DNA-binding GntR family transcriptional regulator
MEVLLDSHPLSSYIVDKNRWVNMEQNNDNSSFSPPLLLGNQIFNFLREQIITGQLQEGSKLNEISLQTMFKTSRTPIREALRRLEVEGLIEVLPRRGAFVRKVSLEDLREATEVRASLESLAISLAAKRLDAGQLRNIGELVNKMDETLKQRDVEAYTKVHHAFHRALVEASGNQILIRIHAMVTEPFVTNGLTYEYMKHLARFGDMDHGQIYELLRSGKGQKASKLIEKHIKALLPSIRGTGPTAKTGASPE